MISLKPRKPQSRRKRDPNFVAEKKVYSNISVYEASKARLRLVFENFPRVCVAFSGGKDSTVLLHLAIEVAREMSRLPVDAMLIDLEGQYTSTMDHVREMFDMPEVRGHWICLPLNLRNASSATHPYWCAWEPGMEDEWVRPMPQHPAVISDPAALPFFKHRMEFEEFVPAYNEYLAKETPTAFVVGIRADESLNRFKSVKVNTTRAKKCAWSTPDGTPIQWSARDGTKAKAVSFFPIYDWRFDDLWHYINARRLPYNRLYDMMYLAGIPFPEMRICQPYGDDQRKGLDLFHKIEPQTWFRIVQRVEGANYAAHYARQKMLGYKGAIGLPKVFTTWKQYVDFLMGTLPPPLRDVYDRRIKVFQDWWAENGYPLDAWPDESIQSRKNGRRKPSWRRVALSILKQDMGKGLSFGFARQDADRLIEIKERFADL